MDVSFILLFDNLISKIFSVELLLISLLSLFSSSLSLPKSVSLS